MSKNLKENKRRERRRLTGGNVLVGPHREGFQGCWINDMPGELERHLEAGWTFVRDDLRKTYEGNPDVEAQAEANLRRVVNRDPRAACRYAYWMEIPLEYFQEDQKAEQDQIDAGEKAFDKRGLHNQPNGYGKIDIIRS